MVEPHIYRNLPPTSKDELARDTLGVLIKGSGTSNLTSAVFYAFTLALALAQAPALTQTPAPALGLPSMYTNIDLQRATKLALELFFKGWEHSQL